MGRKHGPRLLTPVDPRLAPFAGDEDGQGGRWRAKHHKLPLMAHAMSRTQTVQVTIRDVRGADELRACQDLQRRAWGITEDGYILPVATMAGAQKVGGLILGAFDDVNHQLVGFAFAFLGRLKGRLILYSQLTGVHPAHQSTGIGRMLKFEQRARARDMGLDAVVWAFDPLQASNAAFNLGVLGATCSTYEVDLYGSRTDALNAGLATDRLLAEWPTGVEPAAGRTEPWPDGIDLIQTRGFQELGLRIVASVRAIPSDTSHVHIQIPWRIADVKAYGPPGAAREWQLALRDAFQAAFAAGFVAIGFSRADPYQPCYLLERSA
jgi:predicted GNAT superfamily acetyltransferase